MTRVPSLREDLELREEALSLGWVTRPQNRPNDGLIFVRGDKVVWHCTEGWACAECIDGRYLNHRYHPSLRVVLAVED